MPDDEEPDELLDEYLGLVITYVYEDSGRDGVPQALLSLLIRIANTRKSIFKLCEAFKSEHGHQLDVASLLRVMFDAYIQAEYIVRDPAEAEARAKLYLDYKQVERYLLAEWVLAHDNFLSRSLKKSEMKPEGEKLVQAEYDRVKALYLKPNGKPRSHWYKGNLAQLAKDCGREDEYQTFIAPYHGCVHSGPYAVHHGPMADDVAMKILASNLTARVLMMNVKKSGYPFAPEQISFIEAVSTSVLRFEEIQRKQACS